MRKPAPVKRMVEEAESAKPLYKLEKTVLETLIKANPLLHVEPDVDDTWMLASPRLLHTLTRQLIRLNQLDKACNLCCSLHWVQQAVRELGVHSVLETFNLLWQVCAVFCGSVSVYH